MASLSLDTMLCPANGLDLVLISENELLVQFGSRSRPSELFRDNDLTDAIGAVVRKLLFGSTSLRELLSCVPANHLEETRNFIESLVDQGIISVAAHNWELQYLSYTLTGSTGIATHKILIFGAGPVAARIAHNLVRQGIGYVSLVDDRPIDETWLGAVPFGTSQSSDVGRPADIVLIERLRGLGFENVRRFDWSSGAVPEEALEESNLVILALEQPNMQLAHAVNRACVRSKRPWLHVVIDGNLGLIGPQFCSPDTACYNDYQSLTKAASPSGTMSRLYRKHILANPKTSFFVGLPGFTDVVSGHGSIAAFHFLICGTSHLVGRVMTVDFDGMNIDVEDVLKLPRCPICATRRPCYRPPFPEGVETAA